MIKIEGVETYYGKDGEDGIAAKRVYTLQQVINAMNANFAIVDQFGNGFTYWIQDENGERESNEEETLEKIAEAIRKGTPVYAAFYLDCGKLVKEAPTTLRSNYYVGQSVYILSDNQVMQATIGTIQIVKTKSSICARYKTNSGLIAEENRIGATLEELFDKMRKEIKK